MILDKIQVAQADPSDLVLLSLDAEKTFDQVSWAYLAQALLKFGLKAFTLLYMELPVKVYTSGFLSSSFTISNGARQDNYLCYVLNRWLHLSENPL